MHTCPDCGQACYCHGDIDDCEVETEEYASEHCVHHLDPECDGYEGEDHDPDKECCPTSWSEPDKQICGTCGAMHFGRCPNHCDQRRDDD